MRSGHELERGAAEVAPGAPDAGEVVGTAQAPDDAFLRLQDVVAGLPAESEAALRSYLYRIHPPVSRTRGEPAYVQVYHGPVELEDVQREHGGGEYRLLVKHGRQLLGDARFAVQGEPKGMPAPWWLGAPTAAPAAASTSPAAGPPPPPWPAGWPPAAPAASTLQDRLAELSQLATIMRELRGPTPDTSGTLDVALKIVELVKGAEEESTTTGQIAALAREVLPLLASGAHRGNGAAPDAMAPPAQAPPVGSLPTSAHGQLGGAVTPTAPEDPLLLVHHYLERHREDVARLVDAARAYDDPAFWAEYVLRVLPPVVELVNRVGVDAAERAVLDYLQTKPELAPRLDLAAAAPWLRSVLENVAGEVGAEDEPDPAAVQVAPAAGEA